VSMPAPIEFKQAANTNVARTSDRTGLIIPFPTTAPSSPSPVDDIVSAATPRSLKRGKSLSRRTGQNGHIEKSGRWFVVRYWRDIAGLEKRQLVRERICPISGPGRLSKKERRERA
jgi:hypothetical protein